MAERNSLKEIKGGNVMENKITVYNFYENEINKDCCVYKVNLT